MRQTRKPAHRSTPNRALISMTATLAPFGAALVVHLVLFAKKLQNSHFDTPFDAKLRPDFIETILSTVWFCVGGAFGAFGRKSPKAEV